MAAAQDLMALDLVPELIEAGVSCFKIEGRVKGPEYVALATRAYREAVDKAWAARIGATDPEAAAAAATTTTATATSTAEGAADSRTSADASAGEDAKAGRDAKEEARRALAARGIVAPDDAASAVERGKLAPDRRAELGKQLAQTFARAQDAEHDGLTPGFLEGPRHQRLVRGRSPGHRGLLLGEVEAVRPSRGEVVVRLAEGRGVKRGDGVAFDGGRRGVSEAAEQGGSVYGVADADTMQEYEPSDEAAIAGRRIVLRFGRAKGPTGGSRGKGGKGGRNRSDGGRGGGGIDLSDGGVRAGDLVWRSHDAALEAATKALLRQAPTASGTGSSSSDGKSSSSSSGSGGGVDRSGSGARGVRAKAAGVEGSPLELTLIDANGLIGVGRTDVTLSRAEARPLTSAALAKAVGTLNDKNLELSRLDEEFAARGSDAPDDGGSDGADAAGATGATGAADAAGATLDALAAAGNGLFLPASAVKAARRDAAANLLEARAVKAEAPTLGLAERSVLDDLMRETLRGTMVSATSAAATSAGATTRGAAARAEAEAAGADDDAEVEEEEEMVGAVDAPELTVLCRTPAQVEAALELPWLKEVTLDFLEVHGLQAAVKAVQTAGRAAVVATPRVLKPNEERLWRFYLRLGADALLVRSSGLLRTLLAMRAAQSDAPTATDAGGAAGGAAAGDAAGGGAAAAAATLRVPELRGDASLNAANALSAAMFLGGVGDGSGVVAPATSDEAAEGADAAGSGAGAGAGADGGDGAGGASVRRSGGLARLTPSHDLSAKQLVALAEAVGPAAAASLEIVLHQHLPVFHTEHCVFCRFLSEGSNYSDCGHPCETNSLHLRDAQGHDHLVLADMGCRNTVFSAQAQSGVQFVPRLVRAGLRRFRCATRARRRAAMLSSQPPPGVHDAMAFGRP